MSPEDIRHSSTNVLQLPLSMLNQPWAPGNQPTFSMYKAWISAKGSVATKSKKPTNIKEGFSAWNIPL